MTNANMKLIVLGVTCPDSLVLNDAKLEEGEHIVKRVVEISQLFKELRGELREIHFVYSSYNGHAIFRLRQKGTKLVFYSSQSCEANFKL